MLEQMWSKICDKIAFLVKLCFFIVVKLVPSTHLVYVHLLSVDQFPFLSVARHSWQVMTFGASATFGWPLI